MTEVVDYTRRDFQALMPVLQQRVREVLPEWTGDSPADFMNLLLEAVAYIGDGLHYYLDRALGEAFLETATQRRNVLRIARMFDYLPVSQQAASCTVQFTIDTTVVLTPLTIPAGTAVATAPQALGEGPVYFETSEDLEIDPGTDTTGTVTAYEGRTVSLESVGRSTGTASQTFPLFYPSVIWDSWRVFVAEGPLVLGEPSLVEWRYFEHLINADGSDGAFSVSVDEFDVTSIALGDNVSGRVPATDTEVKVTYRYGVGELGNVGIGAVQELVTSILGVTNVTNTTAATGGADPETIEEMKRSIPDSLRDGDRAVTLADYETIAKDVAGVFLASAEAQPASYVRIYITPTGAAVAPGAPLLTSVEDYVESKCSLGTYVTAVAGTYVPINVTCDIVVNDRYVQSSVQTAVEEAITNLLAYVNSDFGKTTGQAEVWRAIVDVAGIDLVTSISVLSKTGSGVSNVTCDINEVPIPGTITVNATGGIA